jgi:hypothetical protein
MEIIKKYLTNGQYLTAEFEKDSLFLHHTVGLTAEGAWNWWNQTPERVGTPFIIDRNGIIIECFNPKYWAYHLGLVGDDNYHEKHSVNVELVSGGRLYEKNGEFYFYPLYPNTQYYTKIPKDDVFTLSEPWRGHLYYHKYTELQLKALKEFIPYIVKLFPKIVLPYPLGDFFEYDFEVVKDHKSGLWSHSTVRVDKDDIFPYPPLLETLEEISLGLTKPVIEPKDKPKTKQDIKTKVDKPHKS